MNRSPRLRAPLALSLLVAAAPASASIPLSAYVAPTRVDFFPDQATATEVVIHGAFFFYLGGNPPYGAPKCGEMYFHCKPGEEAMCRMQWNEVNKVIGQGTCIGFGQQNMKVMGTFWGEGAALGPPDGWDNGMGTFVTGQNGGFGQWCGPAVNLNCPLRPPPMVDMGGQSPPDLSMGQIDLSVLPDLVMMARQDMSQKPGADLSIAPPSNDMAAKATPDLAVPLGPQPVGASCAVGGRSSSGQLPLLLAAISVLVAIGRRSRRV
jgi:hypothetical protein